MLENSEDFLGCKKQNRSLLFLPFWNENIWNPLNYLRCRKIWCELKALENGGGEDFAP